MNYGQNADPNYPIEIVALYGRTACTYFKPALTLGVESSKGKINIRINKDNSGLKR